MKSFPKYDYVIAGAGCAGLSLLMHMIGSGSFGNKKILLIDKEEKNKNDHTWCFWEKEEGLFEEIVHKKWQQAWFHGDDFSKLLSLAPYTYKLIRSIDLYKYCFDIINRQSNIQVVFDEIKKIESNDKETFVETSKGIFYAGYIFNSILFEKPVLKKNEYYLLQHFKGWIIETEKPVFNSDEATLMDFRIDQQHGTAFVYTMPFSSTTALIEYTLFTGSLLEAEQYNKGLREYIERFFPATRYKIEEEEFGVIPMTNYSFPSRSDNIINIGTAGGQTKASSGYTFQFIQKHSASIVEQLVKTGKPFVTDHKKRFKFYDSVLLDVLYNKRLTGKKVFSDLFSKNKPQRLLRFLDNESSFAGELKIVSSLPTWPFLKAAIKQL